MKNLIKTKTEKTKCAKCGRNFEIVWTYYPCNMEGRHESYYTCPYCGEISNMILRGNEDVDSKK